MSTHYIPPSMKQAASQEEHQPVKEEIPVTSSEPIRPMSKFQGNFISEQVLQNMKQQGITEPTVVQRYVIPAAIKEKDLLVCAPTGMGKTIAFLVPALNFLLSTRTKGSGKKARVKLLVLTPTRELAIQINNDCSLLGRGTGVISRVIYGGDNRREQINSLRGGADILIGTPGRMNDFLAQGVIHVDTVEILVFDEADRMLDMGFEPQIRSLLEYLDPNKGRQTMMFSATFPKPLQMIARDFFQKQFLEISIGHGTLENITQEIVFLETSYPSARNEQLLRILGGFDYAVAQPSEDAGWSNGGAARTNLVWKVKKQEPKENKPKVVVFVETKQQCVVLESFLQSRGIGCTSIHGDKSQREREDSLGKFRLCQRPILIATSVAARGLDIPGIELVVNYNMPSDVKEYVHRIGRTGRAGNRGRSVTFFTEEDRAQAAELIEVIKSANQAPPQFLHDLASARQKFKPKKFVSKQRAMAIERKPREREGPARHETPEAREAAEPERKEKLSIKSIGEWAEDASLN